MANIRSQVLLPILYLEGVKFPFDSVTINEAVNRPPTIQISIPPNRELLDIKYRTTIHLFIQVDGGDPELLFEGEVVNHSYDRSETSRHMVIHGMGPWNYLITNKAYYFPEFGFASEMLSHAVLSGEVSSLESQGVSIITAARSRLSTEAFQALIRVDEKGDTTPDIQEFLIKLIDQVSGFNEFNVGYSTRYRLRDRIVAFSDSQASDLYLNKKFGNIVQNVFSQAPLTTPLMHAISDAMGVFYYDIILPAAPFVANRTNIFTSTSIEQRPGGRFVTDLVLKPHTAYTSPPTCNIVFPSDISRFSFTKGGLFREPTRARATVNAGSLTPGGELPGNAYFSPGTMKAITELISLSRRGITKSFGQVSTNPSQQQDKVEFGVIQSDFLVKAVLGNDAKISDFFNEDIHGIIPLDFKLSDANYMFSAKKFPGKDADKFTKAIISLVEYEHINRIHQERELTVNAVFKPDVVAGFPAVVVDNERSFFGEVASVSHTLDSRGHASTVFTMTYVHDRDVFSVSEISGDGSTSLTTMGLIDPPLWYNEFYLQNQVGPIVYRDLIGVGSIMDLRLDFGKERNDRIVKESKSVTPEFVDGERVEIDHVSHARIDKNGEEEIVEEASDGEFVVPRTLVGASIVLLNAEDPTDDERSDLKSLTKRPRITLSELFGSNGWYQASSDVMKKIDDGEIPDLIEGGRLYGDDLQSSSGAGKTYEEIAGISGILPSLLSQIPGRIRKASFDKRDVVIRALNLFRERGFVVRG